MNFEKSLALVLNHEGGYVEISSDPGGATNRGVTLKTFRHYYGQSMTRQDLKNISHEQLVHIYREGYWDACRCDQLPMGVDYAVFDGAVNSGVSQSIRWLQRAVATEDDGIIGNSTLKKIIEHPPAKIIDAMLTERLKTLKRLSIWKTFGAGWQRRILEVKVLAKEMATSCK